MPPLSLRHFPQAKTLLEIGCGTGFVLRGLRQAAPHLRLFGADLYSDSLNFAARRAPDADLFQMDARAIPFAAAFDVIGAFDVIEHIEEDTAVLAQMHRSLRPGGGLMLTVPQHPALWSRMDTISYHKRRYTRRELVAKVEAAGFGVDYVTSFVMLLLPAMLLARLIRHRRRAQFNPLAEFTINPALNRLLAAVMALEGWLLQAGMRFPAGGSLLLVAHKR
jgi:SAM-dependent methyltransferase